MASLFKETAFTKKKGIVYPERVIISMLTHGGIIVKEDGTEKTFVMPEGIKVKRGYASVPGVCNYVRDDTNAFFVNEIQSFKRQLENVPFENIDDTFKIILNKFKERDEETVRYNTGFVKKKPLVVSDDNEEYVENAIDAERYINAYDKFFKMSTYLPGETVIDKLFSRTNKEVNNKPSKKGWVAIINNVGPNSIDLFTLMRPQTREGSIDIYLSEIVDYLKNQGVKEIIMFDNSCSNFNKEDTKPGNNDTSYTDDGIQFKTYTDPVGREYTDKEIRKRRRSIETSSTIKFGGKRKQKYTTFKKRKTKRKTTKKHRLLKK